MSVNVVLPYEDRVVVYTLGAQYFPSSIANYFKKKNYCLLNGGLMKYYLPDDTTSLP